jgi:hypothetical protein
MKRLIFSLIALQNNTVATLCIVYEFLFNHNINFCYMKKIFFDFRDSGRASSTNELFTKELAQTVGKFNLKFKRGGFEILKKPIYYFSGMFSYLLVLFMFILMMVSCEKSIEDNTQLSPAKIDFTTIAQGELYGDPREGTEQNVVVKTTDEWSSLIDAMRLENSNVTNIAETDIDFTQYQVIAVFGEVKENGGWNIDITDITEYIDSSIVVSYANIGTGHLINLTAQPFHIVKIPASNNNIRFQDTNVIYKSCPCEEQELLGEDVLQGEAYLFRDSIPQQMYHQIRAENPEAPDEIRWIIFNSQTGETNLIIEDFSSFIEKVIEERMKKGGNPGRRLTCIICNLPDFAKEWTLSQNGCKVYIEGIPYATCGSIHIGSYMEYLLTRLKRR